MTDQKADLYLKAFGMSGLQARLDLEEIESVSDLNLFSEQGQPTVRKLGGFDQFESEIRRQAAEMSEYYEIFYCLEVSIRQLVKNTLHDAEGPNWWDSERIIPDIRSYVDQRQAEENDSVMTRRSDSDLDYLTFGHLKEIITKNFDVFNSVLTSKRAVEGIMTQLIQLRNPIAHCCPLAQDEKDRLELTVRDWFRVRS